MAFVAVPGADWYCPAGVPVPLSSPTVPLISRASMRSWFCEAVCVAVTVSVPPTMLQATYCTKFRLLPVIVAPSFT